MAHDTKTGTGFFLGMFLHILFQPIFFILVATFVHTPYAAFGVLYVYGLTQFIYIIPAGLIAWKRGASGVLKGLINASAITFLLNAPCDGLLFLGR